MKILAFAASSSKKSINKQLVTYAAGLMEGAEVEVLDLNDYELPLFSVDKEQEMGSPPAAQSFLDKIGESDAVIISFAEHNGSYSAAYKNLFDWCSRIETKVFQGKPLVILSTSPGGRGGASVLALAAGSAPHFDGDVKATCSVPKFHENFDVSKGIITNQEIAAQVAAAVMSIR